jgi:DNA-binding response OmpR family regulator
MSLLWRARGALVRRREDQRGLPVLVVEDDAGVRAYLAAVLEHAGYWVIAAESGEEALELLGNRPAKLAVLDLALPGMDGFAVAERLAAGVPVIMVTGHPETARARDPLMHVMEKPVAPDELEAAVAEVL